LYVSQRFRRVLELQVYVCGCVVRVFPSVLASFKKAGGTPLCFTLGPSGLLTRRNKENFQLLAFWVASMKWPSVRSRRRRVDEVHIFYFSEHIFSALIWALYFCLSNQSVTESWRNFFTVPWIEWNNFYWALGFPIDPVRIGERAASEKFTMGKLDSLHETAVRW
jgi:hypothetical protein